jgi:PAS domain S-box-containing protein
MTDSEKKRGLPFTSPLPTAWLCQQIVAEARDAVIFADTEGIIRLWNRGAEEIFGHPAAAALGRPLDLIIPEFLRERHNQGYRRVMATGRSKYSRDLLAVPALRQDGAQISVEFTIILVQDPEGRLAGAAAIIRDVTDRWRKDQELHQRLAQLEARLTELSS